ncbi:putative CRAL-TRIO lipid binding domain-containing protein [Dioscorea sansibarensis]
MDEEVLLEKLEPFKIQGRDKQGRKILRIVGKFFPGRMMNGNGNGIKQYLEKRIFPELEGKPFVVVFVHTYVQRSDNFPGVAVLRSVYEALPAAIRDGIHAVYFVHPGLQARLFLATLGRFLFSSDCMGR